MRRRSFIKTTASTSIGLALGSHSLRNIQLRSASTSDITVIGAGVFGVWTAFYLQELGANVTLIDAYGPGNSRASSGGESRILRSDYGERLLYSKMNIRAYELWQQWQAEWGAQFLYLTGRLKFGTDALREPALAAIRRLEPLGVTGVLLDRDELEYRWPQVNYDGISYGLYFSGGAGGSTLMAREACRIVAEKFVQKGGKLIIAKASPGPASYGLLASIKLNSTSDLHADQYVFACGPWMANLFPDIFSSKLKVYRRDVLFVGSPSGDARYAYPNFPVWSFTNPADARYYGIPDIRGRGVKIAPWPDYNSLDMDRDDRLINPYEIKRTREFVAKRFPGLAGQPITEVRVCQLTMSRNEHFIIDRHPELNNVWFVCAGSGHGFKHGPALGEYVAKRVLQGATNQEYDSAFRL